MPGLTPSAAFLLWLLAQANPANAPAAAVQPAATTAAASGREYLASWGYSGASFARSDLHISQPSLGSDFTLVGVRARDSMAWTDLFRVCFAKTPISLKRSTLRASGPGTTRP